MIAVPIAGSLVLIILILLAAKVLRQDTKRQRQSVEVRKQRQFKTNLLLNGNSSMKRYHYNHRTNQFNSNQIELKIVNFESLEIFLILILTKKKFN